ncbi:MAG: cytochrome P450 [Bacteriovorax sp.]|nr:cytochrome P450 [Bacteriovorax sp.]
MIFPLNLYTFLNHPKHYLSDLQKKYGDPFPLSFPGVPTIWLTGQSELARAIFTAPVDSFMASENNPVGALLGPSGLIMQSGGAHLEMRKEFTPHFSKRNLLPMNSSIQAAFFDFYDSCPEEGFMSLQEFAFKTTLKTILKLLFPHLSILELHEAEVLTEDFLKNYSASFLFIPQWVPGTWKKFNRKKLALDERFYEFYLSGKLLNSVGPLAVLENKTKNQILDHIRTFIVAGHETSATSLTWALYYLHAFPQIKERLKEELSIHSQDSFIETLFQSNYLDCIVNEALRLEPPVPFVTRKIINRNFQMGERLFKVGEEIGVSLTLLHQQPHIWEEAHLFNPDRFEKRRFSPYEFAAFGGGIRKCIGAELSLMEIKILLAHFLSSFDCQLLEGVVPISKVMQITVGPRKKIMVYFKKRS